MGPNFRAVHLNIEKAVAIAVDGTDEVAECTHAIHSIPDGRPATVTSATVVTTSPEGEIFTSDNITYIVSAIKATVPILRGVHDDVGEEDTTSADILEDLIGRLEQQARFLSFEIRQPLQ